MPVATKQTWELNISQILDFSYTCSVLYSDILLIISCPVSRAYSPAVLDLSKLLILAGRTCWILKSDIILTFSCPVSRAYSPAVLDLSKLLILAGRTCWILYVDILVLGKGQFVVFTLRVKN